MLFNSFEYILFFPVVVVIFFNLPYPYRRFFLLAASYYFYMCWRVEYAAVLLTITTVDYWAGLRMGACATKAQRRKYAMISIVSNLGLLCTFKYLSFFNETTRHVFTVFGMPYSVPYLDILLPMGISFHTFQTMAYTIDVYRGQQKPEKSFTTFALYVVFFPQLVAGPIERAGHLIPQFYKKHRFIPERVSFGLKLMAWGFFKKIVIADRLALLVNRVYSNPHEFNGIPLILATVFFAFQIYCDFSGYTDIAIGSARVLGIKLRPNFNAPYLAQTIQDFWRRWHMSLTSWFRDYVYFSLGGNRVSVWRWYMNVYVVFLLCGLWHGANWTFVVWGALHGSYYVFSLVTKDLRIKWVAWTGLDRTPVVYPLVKMAITFTLVCFAWIFFRANSLSDAWYIVTHFFDLRGTGHLIHAFGMQNATERMLGMNKASILLSLALIVFMGFSDFLQASGRSLLKVLSAAPAMLRFLAYYALLWGTIMMGVFGKSKFIYFQF